MIVKTNFMPVETVIFQHADEAAFIWNRRAQAVSAATYRLDDLDALDTRLDANIDGLRIAGDDGWRMAVEQLSWQEGGEVFTAAVLALESGRAEKIEPVLEAALADYDGVSTSDAFRGLVSAFGWVSFERVRHRLEAHLASDSPQLRTIGIAGSAIHRQNPGLHLKNAIESSDPILRARALKAAGELGRVDLLNQLHNATSEDERSRFYRAWSMALLGWKEAAAELQIITVEEGQYSERAADCAVRLMPIEDARAWLTELSGNEETTRLAAKGAGALGDPAVMTWLLSQMDIPNNARAAGEAFSMITGVDIAYDDLEADWPEGFEAGPTDEPDDENVEMDRDEDLPFPNPELIKEWWNSNRDRFSTGQRYFLGLPLDEQGLKTGLVNGFQRQRIAAALELALSEPESVLLEVRAPGFRQIASL